MRNIYELTAFICIGTSALLGFIIQIRHKMFLTKQELFANLSKEDKMIATTAFVIFIIGFALLLLSF